MQSYLDVRKRPLKVFVRDNPARLSRSCAQAAALRMAVQLLLLVLPEVQQYQHVQRATQVCSRGTGDLWAQNCCSD